MRRHVKPYVPRVRLDGVDHLTCVFARWCVLDALPHVFPLFQTRKPEFRGDVLILRWLATGSEDARFGAAAHARFLRDRAQIALARSLGARGILVARVAALDALASSCVYDREHTNEGTIAHTHFAALRVFKRRKGEGYGKEHAVAAEERQANAREQIESVRGLFESSSARERLRAHRWPNDPWIAQPLTSEQETNGAPNPQT